MQNVIAIESIRGPFQGILREVLRMVPERDKKDPDLQRLLAFRLRTDGEGATREFLMRGLRDMAQSAHGGRLYDFMNHRRQAGPLQP